MNQWEGMEVFDPKLGKKEVVPDTLPSDNLSELSLLATLIYWGNTPAAIEVSISLIPEDFYNPINRYLFQAMRSLQSKGSEINFVTLNSELERLGLNHKVGGYERVTEIINSQEVERPEVLVELLKEKSRLRNLISIGSKIVQDASGLLDSGEILSGASEAITRIAINNPKSQLITDMSDLIDDLKAGRAITTANGGRAMSWGDDTLDNICPIPRGEPTLIVARPGVGKSALGCIQIPVATYLKGLGIPLVLSLEMNRQKVKARMAAHLTGTNSRSFRDAHYTHRDVEAVDLQRELLTGIKWMFPNQECPVEEIEALIHFAVETYGINCVVLDQFSHLRVPKEAKNEPFAMANAALSRRITAIAKNMDLGWVTLGQLNKDGEDNRRPNMKDLADTDRLAKDAAVILGLWNTGKDENQEVWGTIIKNRDDGYKGWNKQLASDYGTCKFRIMEHETEPNFRPSALNKHHH